MDDKIASQPIQNIISKASEPVTEPVYPAEDLAKAAKTLFGTTYEVVITAMKLANKKQATEKEAKDIVSKFVNKEVK